MKVIQINATYGFSSTGVIVKDIEEMLMRNNDESGVVYQFAERAPVKGYQIGGIIDWKFHALFSRIFGRQAYASRLATRKMLRWLKTENPDVVHLHNLHSNYINLNLLLDFLAKEHIATIITLHDCWFFTGKCFHYVESNCEKWKSQCEHCPRKKLDIKSLFFDQSKRVYRDKKHYLGAISKLLVIGCSDWICNEAKQSLLKGKNIKRIYNGVDTQLFFPHSTNIREIYGLEKEFLIFGAANKWLAAENRFVFKSIVDTMEKDERLILFGCTAEQKESIKKFANVICLDYIHDKKLMSDWFASVDVFANVTHADTLPTVNMEAAACGTPIVTYETGGSPELVLNGYTGYVVKIDEVKSFMEKIQLVKSGMISRERCRAFAVEKFDKHKNYLMYLQEYKKLLDDE